MRSERRIFSRIRASPGLIEQSRIREPIEAIVDPGRRLEQDLTHRGRSLKKAVHEAGRQPHAFKPGCPVHFFTCGISMSSPSRHRALLGVFVVLKDSEPSP